MSKDSSKEIVIGGNRVITIFLAGMIVFGLGYVIGRAMAGDPVSYTKIVEQVLPIF